MKTLAAMATERATDLLARADQAVTGRRHLTRGASVLRIGVGAIIVGQQLVYWPERHALWGAGATWQAGEVAGQTYNSLFDVFVAHPSGLAFELLYGAVAVAGALILLGWRTRFVLPVALVLHTSQWRVNPAVWDGDFNLLRITMIYLLLVAASDHWSLDARRRASRGATDFQRHWLVNLLHNAGIALITLQICLVYVGSAMFKTQGALWQHGTAMNTILQLQEFAIWPEVNEQLLQHHVVLGLVAYVTVYAQMFFPLLLLQRWTRVPTLLVVTGMHVGIAVLMGLPFFSLSMIVIDLMFIRDTTYARADVLLRGAVAAALERRRTAHAPVTSPAELPTLAAAAVPRPRSIDLTRGADDPEPAQRADTVRVPADAVAATTSALPE